MKRTAGSTVTPDWRGTTADEVKESFLFDFGFDENGVRRFELGNTVLEVRLQKDLKLDMFDTNKQKAVKSVPKTGADPALYQLAKDEIADMRSNIKKAYTIRKWELFDCYIEKTVFSPEKWSESYLKNAFLHVLAELLVWQQEGKTFTCSDGGLITADGAEYALSVSRSSLRTRWRWTRRTSPRGSVIIRQGA